MQSQCAPRTTGSQGSSGHDRDRPHLRGARVQIDDPQRMVVRVGDVEPAVGDGDALRLPEASHARVAVPVAGSPVAHEGRAALRRRVDDLDPVVVGVGDVEHGRTAGSGAGGAPVLYVADTYNNRIKIIDPATKRSAAFVGNGGSLPTKAALRFVAGSMILILL